MPEPALLEDLRRRWHDGVAAAVDGAPTISVLFSGGLDSSLVAWSARTRADETLLTVGLPGSHAARWGGAAASRLGLPHRSVTVSEDDLDRAVARFSGDLEGRSRVSAGVLLGLCLGLGAADARVVLTGQGADELFLGYSHFEGRSDAEAVERADADWGRLVRTDWPAAVRAAHELGHELRSPFLVPAFSEFVRSLPFAVRRGDGERKALLRALARAEGLPAELADRRKTALQYGSGIDRWLRRRGYGRGVGLTPRAPEYPSRPAAPAGATGRP